MKSRIQRTEFSGLIWLLATVLLWSLIGVLSKFCMSYGMSPGQCAFFRAFFGGLGFFIHAALTHKLFMPVRDALVFMFFGIWGFGAYFTLCQFTIMLSGAAMDIVLQYTAPFWVALFAFLFFGETLSPAKIFSMICAAAGTLLVCFSGGSIPGKISYVGIACGLLSGLCYATHYPFTRFWQKHYSTSGMFAWMLAGGAAFLLPAMFITESTVSLCEIPFYVLIAAAVPGLICTYGGYFCYGEALRHVNLVRAVVTTELEPVLSVIWVWLAFGERFSPIGLCGSSMIILSVLVMTFFDQKK